MKYALFLLLFGTVAGEFKHFDIVKKFPWHPVHPRQFQYSFDETQPASGTQPSAPGKLQPTQLDQVSKFDQPTAIPRFQPFSIREQQSSRQPQPSVYEQPGASFRQQTSVFGQLGPTSQPTNVNQSPPNTEPEITFLDRLQAIIKQEPSIVVRLRPNSQQQFLGSDNRQPITGQRPPIDQLQAIPQSPASFRQSQPALPTFHTFQPPHSSSSFGQFGPTLRPQSTYVESGPISIPQQTVFEEPKHFSLQQLPESKQPGTTPRPKPSPFDQPGPTQQNSIFDRSPSQAPHSRRRNPRILIKTRQRAPIVDQTRIDLKAPGSSRPHPMPQPQDSVFYQPIASLEPQPSSFEPHRFAPRSKSSVFNKHILPTTQPPPPPPHVYKTSQPSSDNPKTSTESTSQYNSGNDGATTIVEQYFDDLGNGAYAWGFENSDGTERHEKASIKDEGQPGQILVKEGFYTYNDSQGRLVRVTYRADEGGFTVLDDNRLVN